MADTSAGLTAYTAPGVIFTTDEELKAHYRTEWHRYNLKRKVANLKPLTKEAFEARQSAAANAAAESGHAGGGRRSTKTERNGGRASDKNAPHPKSKAAFYQRAAAMSEEELIDSRIATAPAFGPGHDLFSHHVSDSLEANLQHMARAHGFHIPHPEYVRDIAGLVRYLQEKVYIGCTSLLDGRPFHSVEAVQAHMRDKGKTRFELEGNEEEYAEFYDLDALASNSPLWVEVELDDDDDDDEDEDGVDAGAALGGGGRAEPQPMELDSGAASGAAAAGLESGETSRPKRTAIVYAPALDLGAAGGSAASDDAALIVAGGTKELGHRSLRRYYTQRLRPEAPEGQQGQMMARLLLQYRDMGLIAQRPAAGGAVGAYRGGGPSSGNKPNERSRRAVTRSQKHALAIGLKHNNLIKDHMKSQNIIFG